MRLICPSCETEYEVHDNMIPSEGRDVQCSNCMITWFQSGPTQAAPELEEDLNLDPPPAAPPKPQRAPEDPRPTPPVAPPSSEYEDEDDEDLSSLPPAAVAAMAGKRQSPKIDTEALGVIHDEVKREQTARKSEADPIETQIDLGIDNSETNDRASAARNRMKPQTSVEHTVDAVTEADVDLEAALADDPRPEPATKRELLPDIEEINSTLSDAPDPEDDPENYMEMTPVRNPQSRNRRGFRLGFGLMLLVAAALVGLYVYAPAFAKSVPGAAGFLENYVETLNGTRAWLDRSAQDLVDQITKLLGTVN